MTPKEKAEELVKKYTLLTWKGKELYFEYYKQCAIIAVDEILNNNLILFEDVLNDMYWKEIKQEIENL